jgi:Flp pilus assembly protein TadD
VWDFGASTERLAYVRRVIRRETIRLAVLTCVGVVVFLATRTLADLAEDREREDAAAWHARGLQHLADGNPEAAATALRRAVTKHRGEKQYVLALAEALTRANHSEPALHALQQLREFNPEDPEVNLALARLARAGGDTLTAARYFHHAIYAPDASADATRRIRLELVEMLLQAGETTRANSELIAAAIDLPDNPERRLELGRLFERAGNNDRAADQYRRVLTNSPSDAVALEGAVRTAFALGNYREVVGYDLPSSAAAHERELSAIARYVLTRDPLASRLSSAERRRRLLANIAHLESRWVACGPSSGAQTPDYPEALITLRTAARAPSIGRDTEELENAVARLDVVREQVVQRCGAAAGVERALAIIANLHGVGAT